MYTRVRVYVQMLSRIAVLVDVGDLFWVLWKVLSALIAFRDSQTCPVTCTDTGTLPRLSACLREEESTSQPRVCLEKLQCRSRSLCSCRQTERV